MKAIIVDDEKKARENLRLLLAEYCPEVEILAEASDQASFQFTLYQLHPDVVFFDIQLGSQLAFDILDGLAKLDFQIVFVTAHREYAIEGYRYNALDYLLKPIDYQKLQTTVARIKEKMKETGNKDQLISTLSKQFVQLQTNPKITLADSAGLSIVELADIYYCMGEGTYTTVYLQEEKSLVISKNLKYFEDKLVPYQFFRPHKSYLVNLNFIEKVFKEDGGHIRMKNGAEIPVSRHRKKELYQVLERYSSL